MDLVRHESQTQTQPSLLSPLSPPPPHHPTFPIIAVAIIGILATAFLLVAYYIFVIKCCLNWHRIDLLRRFSFSFSFSRRRRPDSTHPAYSPPPLESRGLNHAAIRSIPLFNFKTPDTTKAGHNTAACECAVCLNEFHDGEKLRIIPNCAHFFHIDCIDVWLQNNANCPLCRTSISIPPNSNPFPSQIPLNPQINTHDNFLVIEIEPNHNHHHLANPITETNTTTTSSTITTSTKPGWKKAKKLGQIGSMGDEWIDMDRKQQDEQFAVQPIRRSFSMDSAGDTQLYLAVQAIMQRDGGHGRDDEAISCSRSSSSSPSEGSSRGKKSFFSFGHSRSAVQPVSLDP